MTRHAVQGLLLGAVLGVAVGIGGYTFVYARGWSYLTNDPAACANCHVMREQYDGWLQVQPPRGGGLQRLPHAAGPHRQVRDQGVQRLLALVRLHHRRLPRADPDQAAQPARSRSRRAATCHADDRRRHRGRRTRAGGGRLACIRCHSVGRPPALTRRITDATAPEDPMADPTGSARTAPRPVLRRRRRAPPLAVIGGVALLVNIFERKQEARNPFYRVVELTDDTDDPAVWGKNFPLQYDGYRRTVDQVRTRYGGSEAVPRTPTEADPALGGGAVAARGGPAPEDDVGRLRLRQGLPRGARPRLHARRPDLHRAPAGRASSRAPACTATPRSTCRTRRPATATSSRASRS